MKKFSYRWTEVKHLFLTQYHDFDNNSDAVLFKNLFQF